MGGSLLYPHSLLHLPSSSAPTRPNSATPFFSFKVIADRPFLSSIKAVDGNREFSKAEGLDGNNPQSSSSLSPNKQEILALFKRIQSSISKGENVNSKKRVSKSAEDSNKPSSAESILEVLHQSRTQGKGKTVGRRGDKFAARQKDSFKKEEISELLSNVGLEKSRPPSSFTKRSPVPVVSGSIDGVQPKNETLPETPSVIIPSAEIELTNERLVTTEVDQDEEQSEKFEDMKLSQLKEVAKSKGIKGYSKLKKSELVELLIRSGIDASS
ncbi:hypothetical protein ABFS82_13G094600 [Erythranthe guttata]|uniref:Rho termination factor-like N-terminal domain-containing protein n=1 Tax=Erythranthe guttata TaxID=4155 RepID=A0A022QNQ7_ERYGU|nr:PREDICTED: SAP-like protein BP-73 [Erythranthe guttata]EYU28105.1 hypothetical protein MIMGU_mgv1a011834mg [Erythranthe guttata]|eukprot:XP_012848716.1 PREDICTED: SAP-like protein BP-73 [Erythranthe guttata]